ncbi:MAG: head GIN domain-containing protein [Bacteroidota bacterium]
MKTKYLFALLLAVVSFSACTVWGVRGSGKMREQIRSSEAFDRIEAGGAYSIKIIAGKPTSITINAEENLLPYIKTRVNGGTLYISSKKNLNPRKELEIFITTPSLTALEVSGANNVDVVGINEKEFAVNLSGAGNVDLKGNTDRLRAEISGAGNINARELKARDVMISVSGAASADVYAKEILDASVSGVGSIDYYGKPEKTRTNVSGVGSITRK